MGLCRRVLVSCCLGLLAVVAPPPAVADVPVVPACDSAHPDVQPPDCVGDGEPVLSVDPAGGPDVGGFVALMVVVGLVGLGLTAWRVSTARDLARKAGMDPDQATAITLLGGDGLDATYVATSLRGPAQPPAPPARTVEERLLELQGLKDQGLVTDEEFQARRAAVLDSL
jgi:hypothetical protein